MPDELTLRKLIIVDDDGKERIVAGAHRDGVGLMLFDSTGEPRIIAGITPDDSASVGHYDRDGKIRISAGTLPDGSSGVSHL
jgi:hypothetical protein